MNSWATATGVLGIVGKGANGLGGSLWPQSCASSNDALNHILGEPEKTFCSLDEKLYRSSHSHNEEVDELISLLTQKLPLIKTNDALPLT